MQGAAEKHYPTMSIDELCALPVPELAAKDCALFLWATFPQLPEALRLIRAWGFRYRTVAFVWLKRNRKSPSWFYGMGYWTRSNAEICLLATKGKPKRQSAGVHQFLISPIEQHSKKPDAAREKIVALMGDLPRIELFARQKTPGWDIWGNELPNSKTLIPYVASNICRTTAKEKNRRAADIFSRPNDNAAVLRNQSRRVLSCDDIKDMAA